MTDTVWSQPHHDGSAMYVPDPNPKLGGKVNVLLRVPRTSDVTSAWVRVINDGEPELVRATIDRQDKRDTWLRAEAACGQPGRELPLAARWRPTRLPVAERCRAAQPRRR